MSKLMFPYLTKDVWSWTPEPEEQIRLEQLAQAQPKRKSEWVWRGFFRTQSGPMSRREVELKASSARLWLETILLDGPRPAKEVLQLAKLEGFSEWGVRRAKKH